MRALYDHVVALLAQGHEVEVWCPPTADRDFLPFADLVPEHVVPLRPPRVSRMQTLSELAGDRLEPLTAMEEHCASVAAEIRGGGFDVLFANSCQTFRTPPIARMIRIPSVLYLQEPFRWLYEAMPEPAWAADRRPSGWWRRPQDLAVAIGRGVVTRRREVQVREEARNAGAFDLVLCNSQYSRESILRAYGLDATVCYLGIDPDRFTPRFEGRAERFLTIGAAMAEKRVDFLVRALGHLDAPRWPLVWVCNVAHGPFVDDVRRLAEVSGVHLEVRQRIDELELRDLIETSGLFLYAPRLEPFGLAPLEAAAAGLPTVAVAEAGTRETIVDGVTGRLVGPSEGEFAAAVAGLVVDAGLRSTLGRQAHENASQRWTLAGAGLRLGACLRSVIGPSA